MVALLVTPGSMALGAFRRSVRRNVRRWGPRVTTNSGREALRAMLRALHSCTDLADLQTAAYDAEVRLFYAEPALLRDQSLRWVGETVRDGAA